MRRFLSPQQFWEDPHLRVDVEVTVALKVPLLALGVVKQEAVFDDEEPERPQMESKAYSRFQIPEKHFKLNIGQLKWL